MAAGAAVRFEDLTLETAAELVAARVPVASPADTVAVLRGVLAGERYDCASHIAVCSAGTLVGVLPIEDLLAAPPDALVGDVMDREPPVVAPHVDREVAAWRAVQHGESALAVVDEQRRFVGLIPPHRLLSTLLWEHDEDMARLGGYLHDTESARTASQEPVVRRFWHRVPWLLIGLAGAFLASLIVGSFESQLEANVTIAFFVPAIVYLADAVGTQTEALAIRGLSVGVGIRQVVWREAITGVLVGLTLAAAFFPFAAIVWDNRDVALAVSISLFAACSVATVVAMALPWVLHRLGLDPAYGSGPLATVTQDVLSIVIYFAVATALV
jgi:magnesium transporter